MSGIRTTVTEHPVFRGKQVSIASPGPGWVLVEIRHTAAELSMDHRFPAVVSALWQLTQCGSCGLVWHELKGAVCSCCGWNAEGKQTFEPVHLVNPDGEGDGEIICDPAGSLTVLKDDGRVADTFTSEQARAFALAILERT